MPPAAKAVIPFRQPKLIRLLVITAIFAVIGVWMLWDPNPSPGASAWQTQAWGVFLILFFGGCGLIILHRSIYGKPALIIDAAGIENNASKVTAGRIAWSDISDIKIKTIFGQQFLAVIVRNPGDYLKGANYRTRAMLAADARLLGTPVYIRLSMLRIKPAELERLIALYRSVQT